MLAGALSPAIAATISRALGEPFPGAAVLTLPALAPAASRAVSPGTPGATAATAVPTRADQQTARTALALLVTLCNPALPDAFVLPRPAVSPVDDAEVAHALEVTLYAERLALAAAALVPTLHATLARRLPDVALPVVPRAPPTLYTPGMPLPNAAASSPADSPSPPIGTPRTAMVTTPRSSLRLATSPLLLGAAATGGDQPQLPSHRRTPSCYSLSSRQAAPSHSPSFRTLPLRPRPDDAALSAALAEAAELARLPESEEALLARGTDLVPVALLARRLGAIVATQNSNSALAKLLMQVGQAPVAASARDADEFLERAAQAFCSVCPWCANMLRTTTPLPPLLVGEREAEVEPHRQNNGCECVGNTKGLTARINLLWVPLLDLLPSPSPHHFNPPSLRTSFKCSSKLAQLSPLHAAAKPRLWLPPSARRRRVRRRSCASGWAWLRCCTSC